MINQLLLIFSAIIIYEFIRFTKFIVIVKSTLKINKKIFKLFTYKKASDLRKQRLIFYYSKSLFISSIKIISIIVIIIIIMFILNLLSNSFLDFVISIFGILEMIVILIIYYQFKKKINAKV